MEGWGWDPHPYFAEQQVSGIVESSCVLSSGGKTAGDWGRAESSWLQGRLGVGSSYTSLWGRVGRGWLGRPLACGLSLKYREFPFQELLQTSLLEILIFCVSLQHGCSGSNPKVSEGLCGSLLEWPAVLMNQTYCNVRQLPSQSFLL